MQQVKAAKGSECNKFEAKHIFFSQPPRPHPPQFGRTQIDPPTQVLEFTAELSHALIRCRSCLGNWGWFQTRADKVTWLRTSKREVSRLDNTWKNLQFGLEMGNVTVWTFDLTSYIAADIVSFRCRILSPACMSLPVLQGSRRRDSGA